MRRARARSRATQHHRPLCRMDGQHGIHRRRSRGGRPFRRGALPWIGTGDLGLRRPRRAQSHRLAGAPHRQARQPLEPAARRAVFHRPQCLGILAHVASLPARLLRAASPPRLARTAGHPRGFRRPPRARALPGFLFPADGLTRMRRVLIASPHFCPVNAADMQRVRLCLPHLRENGWDPTVLALHPDTVEHAVIDPLLGQTYPADIPVVRAKGIPPRLTRPLGFGGLWWRAGRAFDRAGARLLRQERFDLVFFSTTQFDFLRLAPRWLHRSGVPYVLDYQDPWVNDYYRRTGTPPPGGRLRHAFARWRAKRQEPRTLREASAVVSVSPAYLADLARRYPWFDAQRATVLPFGASAGDFALARALDPSSPLVPLGDGRVHLVSTGRAGPDLAPALRLLFMGLAQLRRSRPEAAARLRLHFIGTSYAPAGLGRPSVLPVAQECDVAELVREHPARVPYFEALHYLSRADGILALGSDDPGYTPSKLSPVLLAGRPVLALLGAGSPALDLACAAGATVAAFAPGSQDAGGISTVARWLGQAPANPAPDPRVIEARGQTARAMTRRLAEAFAAATDRRN
ncbi:MAG: hypothetical protein C0502_00400 [Opitutus sp.]|nr:hypothetical protein [Opitutus sp.]